MRLKAKYLPIVIVGFALACKHQPVQKIKTGGGYPEEVGKIILNKCAVTGCHNNISYKGAGGLDLTIWDNLFEGGYTGAVVIPYRPDFSTLCFYTNTDTALGVTLLPTMPVNTEPLSKEEYLILKNWVANGAPDKNGNIKFADNPTREKIYVVNQLCDVVTVFDAETMLQMRYIDAGKSSAEEFARTVKVSPDKKNWYVTFFATTGFVQKFSAADDRPVGTIQIGNGSWTSFVITKDSRYGFFVDNNNPGKIAYADLDAMKLLTTYTFNDRFTYPAGIAISEQHKKAYVGNALGNYIYAIDINDPLHPVIKEVIIDGSKELLHNSSKDPTDMVVDATGNMCYIACTGSGEIRVLDMRNDSLAGVIPLGSNPVHIGLSPSANQLFATCPDDTKTFPGNRGSVVVVDLQNNTVIKRINSGYQPYGIAVHENRQVVAVVNANLSPSGTEPHHSTNCEGRNGNVVFIDLHSLELVKGKRSEVAVFPYSAAAR